MQPLSEQTVENIKDIYGGQVPAELWEIFDEIAAMLAEATEELQSRQVIALVIWLWKRGILPR